MFHSLAGQEGWLQAIELQSHTNARKQIAEHNITHVHKHACVQSCYHRIFQITDNWTRLREKAKYTLPLHPLPVYQNTQEEEPKGEEGTIKKVKMGAEDVRSFTIKHH